MPKATDIPASARAAVRERDRGSCRGCGLAGQGSEVHHIVYRSQERNNHSVDNLVSLCHSCHRIAHTNPGTCRDALLAVVAGEALTMFSAIRRALASTGFTRQEIKVAMQRLRRYNV